MNSHSLTPFKTVLAFLAVFFFLFAPRLNVAGGVSMGMVAVLCISLLAIKARARLTIPRPLLQLFAAFACFATYSAVLAVFYDHNPIYFVSICISAALSIICTWFFAELLVKNNVVGKELIFLILGLIISAIFVNSLIIALEYLIPPVKTAIESFLYVDATANINYADHPFRLRGLASAGGASLSIVNAVGILLIIFLFGFKRLSAITAVPMALLIVLSNIFTGRTGLIFGLAFFLVLLGIVLGRFMRSGIRGLTASLILVFSFGLFLQYAVSFELDPEVAFWAFEWVDGLMSGEVSSTSSDDLGTMLFLPDNVVHLFLGIGFFEGEGRLYPRSDSGYVKSIMSIGLIGSILLYGLLANMLLKLRKIDPCFSWLAGPILVFMFIVEIKEPFLYQNFSARVCFLLSGAAMVLLSRQSYARNSHHSRS